MNKYIYEVNGEYFTIEADSLHESMVGALCEGGTVIGEYTKYAHLFGE
jgi:hypothetical protein